MTAPILHFGTVYTPNATGCDADQVLYVLQRLCAMRDDETGRYTNNATAALEELTRQAWEILGEFE